MSKDWSEFDKFEDITNEYLPDYGEGKDKASQIVTAVCKLVYRWYNDGDVFDNTYGLEGWANDLSSYANWLYANTDQEVKNILDRIYKIRTEGDYEDLLYDLTVHCLDQDYLYEASGLDNVGSIYKCDGPFKFEEQSEEEDDDWN